MSTALESSLRETQLTGLKLFSRGKVRDLYELGDRLLIVATDRISAFDFVLASEIPDKGRVLNQLSLFWFETLRDVVPSHFLTASLADYPAELHPFQNQLRGRSMLVVKARPVRVECVARGYLAGSGWKDYQQTGRICGIPLPAGRRESEALPEPIFTPATKATSGHDVNISFDEMVSGVGGPLAEQLRTLTLALYQRAAEIARARGLLIADTKFEFGLRDDRLLLIDEVLTPDSSRFWAADTYCPGQPQPAFDKQFVRDYLERSGWNKQPPAPPLPPEVIQATRERYLEAYRRLTGKELT
ncbi:MAG: phosphoribosylaminoimidazolesuccinocarboxamide synthase [Acidobacteria bacterium]|nr:phosphoribosylaminoimidazolesuccinocarboxamide synthase [Acidobacteriota bacterium]